MERRIESQRALEAARNRPLPANAGRRPPAAGHAGGLGLGHVDGRLQLHTDSFDFGLDFRNDGSSSATTSSEGSLPASPTHVLPGPEGARQRRRRAVPKRPSRRTSLRQVASDQMLSAATGVAYRGGVPLAGATEDSPPPRRIRRSLANRFVTSLKDELGCHDGPRGGLPYRLTAIVLRVTLLMPAKVLALVLGYAFGLCLGSMDALRHGVAQVPRSLWKQFFRAARRGRGDVSEPEPPDAAAPGPRPAPSDGSLSPGGRTPSLPASPLPSPTASAASAARSLQSTRPSPFSEASHYGSF